MDKVQFPDLILDLNNVTILPKLPDQLGTSNLKVTRYISQKNIISILVKLDHSVLQELHDISTS